MLLLLFCGFGVPRVVTPPAASGNSIVPFMAPARRRWADDEDLLVIRIL